LQAPPKKLIYGLMGFLLVYAIFRSVLAAAGRAFWYDELLTLTVSSLGSWKSILDALRRPLDGQPPFFYVIEHFASGFTRNQEIALRLPSILAFPCTLACVFIYTKKRGGELVALLCAAFVLTTSVFQTYAIEARPYSMVVACMAFALVCYQRAPSPIWMVLLAACLALAQSLHYMAVLAMVPFGLAEAVHFWISRKFRWPVWAALIVGAVPLLLFWNLLAINKVYYGAHFWASFQFSVIPGIYTQLFLSGSEYGAGIAGVVLAGVLGTVLWQQQAGPSDIEEKTRQLAEATLLFGLAALPFAGYLLSSVLHSGMTPRYVLSTSIGVAVALGYILTRAKPGVVALFAVFVFSAVGVQELHFWRSSRADIETVKLSGVAAGKFIESAGHKELPVVVPNGLALLWLTHYASPPATDRLLYPTPDHLPSDHTWTDTVDKGLEAAVDYLPLRVSNFTEFAAAHKEFLLYAVDEDTPRDWLTMRLSREGWSMETVALDDSRRIYLITSRGNFSQ
jgi:hypothetical protein